MCLAGKLEETDFFLKEKVQGDIKTVFQLTVKQRIMKKNSPFYLG